MQSFYFDNNSTTPLLPEVLEAMHLASQEAYANPASQHAAGRKARAVLESAREEVGRLLGAKLGHHGDRILFTSGGTEANHLAVRGLCTGEPKRVLVSTVEHPSTLGAAEHLARRGWHVQKLPVESTGLLPIEELEARLRAPAHLVSILLGQNETGVIQPLKDFAHLCRERGVLLHTDAVQAVGKIDVSFRELGVHSLSAAAHKFHGPLGIGVLIVEHDVPLEPIFRGGFQQAGLRPGTESVVLAVGLRKALEVWASDRQRAARVAALRDRFEQHLLAGAASGEPPVPVRLIAASSPRLPQTSSISFVGLDRQALVMAFDLAGICCSTGSACASGSSTPSTTLTAMGLPSEVIQGAVRFSFSHLNTAEEVDAATARILHICRDLWRKKKR